NGREFFVAEPRALRVYRQEKTLKLLAELKFPLREKVIAIDSAGPDKNGEPKTVASNLPYLFRALALNGGPRRIYAQEMGITEDFFGDLYEMPENGATLEKKHPIKLPRYANIFNYTTLTGPDGKSYATVLSSDGYLVV